MTVTSRAARAQTFAACMVLALVGAGSTGDAAAQETRTTEVAVRAGLRFGVPRDLYRGWITASPDAAPLPGSSDEGARRQRAGWRSCSRCTASRPAMGRRATA